MSKGRQEPPEHEKLDKRKRQLFQKVKFNSPLTWIYKSWQGSITELSPDGLVLAGRLPDILPKEPVELEVRLAAGKSYLLRGLMQAGEVGTAILHLQDEKISLQDLLGQIRKVQHIEICEKEDVESSDRFNGFDRVHFVPEALPELDEQELDTSSQFLGRSFATPLFITGMTGGVELGALINRRLAEAAQALGIPMGVGSQRIACENPKYAEIFTVKKDFPQVFLIGNLGFAQVVANDGLELCKRAVEMIEADGLAIHLNTLQECVQVEGDRSFRGVLKRLEEVCAKLAVPVLVKEVGCGISSKTVKRLLEAGVAAVDVAGRGGTSWGYIEGLRSSSEETRAIAMSFRDWGIPTAYSLASVRQAYPDIPLIATGGIRDGLTVAKACALGANLVGIGLPLMRAALVSADEVSKILQTYLRGLKVAMLTTGSRTLAELKNNVCLGKPLQDEFERYLRSHHHDK